MNYPKLYTFRRCPFAIRARMALLYAQIPVIQIEVDLKNKPPEMRIASPKGTVPVLLLGNGRVIDESLDIMLWALDQSDPDNWLTAEFENTCHNMIQYNDQQFKPVLDNYKYPANSESKDPAYYRSIAWPYLDRLNTLLIKNPYLVTHHITIADIALIPFIRQFYMVDRDWFEQSPLQNLLNWLRTIIDSSLFQMVMKKTG